VSVQSFLLGKVLGIWLSTLTRRCLFKNCRASWSGSLRIRYSKTLLPRFQSYWKNSPSSLLRFPEKVGARKCQSFWFSLIRLCRTHIVGGAKRLGAVVAALQTDQTRSGAAGSKKNFDIGRRVEMFQRSEKRKSTS
jgi:hypothetical protein